MKIPLSFRILRAALRPISYLAPGFIGSYWAKFFMETSRHQRPGWEVELLKKGEAIHLSGKLRAWTFGQGPVVLLAHGWDGRGSQLGKFIEPVVAAGFRVVAFDGPAHGDSPGTWTNLVLHARAMVVLGDDVVGRYGPIHGVIAHSFGAGATSLAVTLGLEIKRVVMIASPCSIQKVIDRFTRFVQMSPKAAQAMQEIVEQATGYRAESIEVSKLSERMPGVKALLFHDPQDEEVPFEEAESIVNAWKDARLVTTPNVGHRRILKHQPVIDEAVQFLRVS